MTIVITGATGTLGRATVDALLAQGIAPDEIMATGRNAERLFALAERGVRTAVVDLDDVDALAASYAGASRVLLVSVPGNPRRVEQHAGRCEATDHVAQDLAADSVVPLADASQLEPLARRDAERADRQGVCVGRSGVLVHAVERVRRRDGEDLLRDDGRGERQRGEEEREDAHAMGAARRRGGLQSTCERTRAQSLARVDFVLVPVGRNPVGHERRTPLYTASSRSASRCGVKCSR